MHGLVVLFILLIRNYQPSRRMTILFNSHSSLNFTCTPTPTNLLRGTFNFIDTPCDCGMQLGPGSRISHAFTRVGGKKGGPSVLCKRWLTTKQPAYAFPASCLHWGARKTLYGPTVHETYILAIQYCDNTMSVGVTNLWYTPGPDRRVTYLRCYRRTYISTFEM